MEDDIIPAALAPPSSPTLRFHQITTSQFKIQEFELQKESLPILLYVLLLGTGWVVLEGNCSLPKAFGDLAVRIEMRSYAVDQKPTGAEDGERRGGAVVAQEQMLLEDLKRGNVHARIGQDAHLHGLGYFLSIFLVFLEVLFRCTRIVHVHEMLLPFSCHLLTYTVSLIGTAP